MHYEDFIIRIASGASGTHPVFVKAPMGTLELTLRLPYHAKHLPGIAAAVLQPDGGVARRFTPDPEPSLAGPLDATTVGVALYQALFQEPVRGLLATSLASLPRTGEAGLRIRLEMNLDGAGMREVASLPWELMRPTPGGQPLSVSTRTPLVRVLDVERPAAPPPFEAPLRVLVITSNPSGTEPLALAEEEARIRQTWGALDEVSVTFVPPHVSAINDACVRDDFHVVHYMGHGGFDPASGRGVLYLERPDGTADPLGAHQLRAMFNEEANNLRLVFLNACKTAMSTPQANLDPFAGVAATLIDMGVPAVIAMQFPVTDGAAATFADTFYRRVAQGLPVDAAVAGARLELYSKGETGAEWATPVLFMRSDDGRLLNVAPPSDADLAEAESARAAERRDLARPARVAALSVPTLVLLLALVVANYWRMPTEVLIELRAGKVAFDVVGAQAQTLLGRSLPFRDLRVRSCEELSFLASSFRAVDPVVLDRPSGTQTFRCGPESTIRVANAIDERARAGALGQVSADAGQPVAFSVTGGREPQLSVDIATRQTLNVVAASDIRLDTDFVDLAEPPPPDELRRQLRQGTASYRATLDPARPVVDVTTADRLELIVAPLVADGFPDIGLIDQDSPPLRVRALQVTGGETLSDRPTPASRVELSYPALARAPRTTLTDPSVALGADVEFRVHRLAITATGLDVAVQGQVTTASDVGMSSAARRVDPRVTALERVYYGPGGLVASAFSLALWLASTLAVWWGLRRRSQRDVAPVRP